MSYNTILATAPLTTQNYHLKMIGTSIGNSLIWDNGTNVGIGNTNTSYTLDVTGTGRFTGALTLGSGLSIGTTLNMNTGVAGTSYIQFNYTPIDPRSKSWRIWNDASQYGDLTISQATTAGGSSYTDRFLITSAGNVGIGTSSPSYKLHVSNNTNGFITRFTGGTSSDVNIGIFGSTAGAFGSIGTESNHPFNIFTNGTDRMTITSGGTIFMYNLGGYSSSNADVRFDTSSKELYYQTSSLRYKINIVDLEDSLQKITYLRPVRYQDKNMLTHSCGLIAEEVAKIIPDVVFKKEIEGFDEPQIEGVNYSDFVPFIIKAIQEMNTKLDEQNQTIQNLQEQINILAK